MNKSIGGAAALLLLSACATPAPAPVELASADGEKVECRFEVVTGSIRKEKVCATVTTWDEADEIRRQQADEQVQRAKRKYNDVSRTLEAGGGVGN
jgi:hypothetical protein